MGINPSEAGSLRWVFNKSKEEEEINKELEECAKLKEALKEVHCDK